MIKVVHIADSLVGGGAEVVFKHTISASDALGFEHKIIVSNEKRSFLSYIFSIKNMFRVLIHLLSFKPNVIHVQNFYHFMSPSIFLSIRIYRKIFGFDAKIVYTAHDYHLVCPNSGMQYFYYGKAFNFPLRGKMRYRFIFDSRSRFHSWMKVTQHFLSYKILKLEKEIDVIISPSFFLKHVLEGYGITSPIVVLRNPVDNLKDNVSTGDAKGFNDDERQEGSQEKIKLIYTGRLSPEKGLFEFLTALEDNRIPIIIHVYGVGPEEYRIRSLIAKGLNYVSVHMHGFVAHEKLLELMSAHDAFVLPSLWYENAPLSIIEAASCGLPVIAPNYGGAREMAALTKSFYLFDWRRDPLFSDMIDFVKSNKKRNFIFDAESFSKDTYANSIMRIYSMRDFDR